jgi:hypothetical protein
MNQKGFAVSGFIYTILILFIGLLIAILALLNSRKAVLDELKNKVLGDVYTTNVVTYDPFKETGEILEFSAKAQGYYQFNLQSPKTTESNGSSLSFEVYLLKGQSLYFLIGSKKYNNETTQIISDKNNLNSIIASISSSDYSISENYNGKIITDVEVSFNNNTDVGQITVDYQNESKKNSDLNKVKYIKSCVNSDNAVWSEIMAIVDGENKAFGKKVTSEGIEQDLSNVVDNSKKTSVTLNGTGEQCLIIDLERTYNLDRVIVYHESGKIPYGNKIYVSTDGVSYRLISNLEPVEDTNGINVNGYQEEQVRNVDGIYVPVKEFDDALWLRVFHHNNLNGTVLWDSLSQVSINGGYDELNKQTILYALSNYKNKSGKFEFLLEYSNKDGYNRWIQTSNPVTTSEKVTGYKAVHIDWNQNNWNGLAKSNSGSTLIDGSVGSSNWYYAIGAIKNVDNGIYSNDSITGGYVDLWVRIDNLS